MLINCIRRISQEINDKWGYTNLDVLSSSRRNGMNALKCSIKINNVYFDSKEM